MKDAGEKRYRKNSSDISEGKNIYCIAGLDNLLNVCQLLFRSGYANTSSVYRDTEQDIYYLIMSEGAGFDGLPAYPIVREYAFLTLQWSQFVCLTEHCTYLCSENAVKTLGNLI